MCVCVFQCMHKHFSAWYSAVLEKRVLLGKAAALCDWRMRLRAWRAWRALVWLGREEREVRRTEHELRLEHKYETPATQNVVMSSDSSEV